MPQTHSIVSSRALLARINRKLAHEGRVVSVSISVSDRNAYGPYKDVDTKQGIVSPITDIYEFSRDLGVLKTWEIKSPNMKVASFRIIGTAPLLVNRFSRKTLHKKGSVA